jgi:hypothetical protein
MIVTRYIDVLSHIKHVTFGVQVYTNNDRKNIIAVHFFDKKLLYLSPNLAGVTPTLGESYNSHAG